MASKSVKVWLTFGAAIVFAAAWSMSIHRQNKQRAEASEAATSAKAARLVQSLPAPRVLSNSPVSDAEEIEWAKALGVFFDERTNARIIKYDFLTTEFNSRLQRVALDAEQQALHLSHAQLLGFARSLLVNENVISFDGRVIARQGLAIAPEDQYVKGSPAVTVPIAYDPNDIACKAGYVAKPSSVPGVQIPECWKQCPANMYAPKAGVSECVALAQAASTPQSNGSSDPQWEALTAKFFAEQRNERFARYDWAAKQFERNMQVLVDQAAVSGYTYTDPQLLEAAREMLVREKWITASGLVYARDGYAPAPWDAAPPDPK